MSKPVVISARIDADTAALLDQLGAAHGRSRSWLVANAVKQMAQDEVAYLAFLKEGEDAIERGDVVSHDDVMAWVAAKRDEIDMRRSDRAA